MPLIDTVLLIDDDEINNMICTKIISKNDFATNVVACSSARQGLKYLQDALTDGTKPLPTVIFLDINMPVMNGWDFLDQYKQMPGLADKGIVLIMLSSSSSANDLSRAQAYPQVSDYITKPLTAAHLQHVRDRFFKDTGGNAS
ncbi:MAG TPA: response regulator [Cytophagales bacterium]|jgi:CheY-like chemotaxis protein